MRATLSVRTQLAYCLPGITARAQHRMTEFDTNTPVRLDDTLVVEDDPIICLRLQRLLARLHPTPVRTTTAGSLQAALDVLHAGDFGLVLVDIGLPDGSGIELIDWLHHERPALPCVVVSSWGHEQIVLEALKAGAIGYLLKERDDEEIVAALQSIQRGGAAIDPAVAKCILAQLQSPAMSQSLPAPELTLRETEVLSLVARGHSNREIAGLTSLSRFTVEDYTKRIYRKLAVGSRTAAVHEAKSRGLL